ncbi:Quinoprotein amine dehydrogenase, beta chain-like protein [Corchorus capsularis]|uniref:Quinoprotein amine dehydrogenase, beta chain-like protein n=1 Tax=Corchorus capsularis TaxID=210143 RepID=A0A1R3JK75_COCAP|nr:Quinoprotein amine dehydrogenase, beta chain-like protein [Corchorus capsularis]
MSAPSVRRQRDLPTGNQKPSKNLTPISNPPLKKSSSTKENRRSTSLSRASSVGQKPTIRPVARVEKAAAAAALGGCDSEGRVRRSTSSVPRGRSQSPSEFIRVFSDLKKDKISIDREKDFRDLRARVCKENVGFRETLVMKVKENERKLNGDRVLDENCKKDVKFSSELRKPNGDNIQNGGFEALNEKGISDFGSEPGACVRVDEKCDAKFPKEKSLNNGKSLEAPKEGLSIQESGTSGVSVKYPSKLHEKLAFLEGKVKRIASDIKRTKEMLDMNNPDASKVILSDIQDKISGIEKAMTHVVSDPNGKTSGSKGSGEGNVSMKGIERIQSKQVGNVKISVKELNSEELEARLFPHHKLLRNRTSLKSSGSSDSQESSKAVDPSNELRQEKKLLSPIENHPIALEFLASLDKDKSKVTTRDEHASVENSDTQEMDVDGASGAQGSLNDINVQQGEELNLESDERLDDFLNQENRPTAVICEETEDTSIYQLNQIGRKTSTGGWFVSEGEAVLLAHDDGSCSFYDIANCEEKSVYKPPAAVSPNIWRDCWVIRAPSADGCAGRYVIAASAGNSLESGFCSWDFYTKDVRAFHTECGETASRTVLGPLSNNTLHRRNALCSSLSPETQQWWYRPCGPLIVSTATSQKVVKVYDIRDGEEIMKWEVQKPVSTTMDYSSPLQWRNRGKVVVAEAEMISVWDVNSLHPQSLLSVSTSGRKISALHVNNTDAEIGGGVRQRVSSSEAEGNDGVFCTADSINIMDFREPSGIGAKIAKVGVNVQSVFSRGDSIYLGCTNVRSSGKMQSCSQVQQFSLRKQRPFNTYSLPETNAHSHHSAITQVWGNSNLVMGVCGMGLFVFDALRDDGLKPFINDHGSGQDLREIIGPDDLYSPSFDYLASRVLLISRDRPALWRHLS